ncbi:MAG: cation:proton antiporter [Verrucomicrobiota bacterium]
MEHGLVIDIAVCIIAAFVAAVACQALKQPLLLAYLLAGFAIGPHGFQWVTDTGTIQTISSIGLILLLFMIGLEIDLRKMAHAGKIILVTSSVQIAGSVLLGWLFFGMLGPGRSWLEGLYLAVAAALGSTVIIVKILYDKRELETLAGRVTMGVLVLQDLFVILFLAIQPDLKDPEFGILAAALGKTLLLVGVAYISSRFVLPSIFRFISRLPELMLVGALAWCFALAGLAGHLGLSREMGALVAGVMISTLPYTLDIAAKVTNIRDFFVTLFFVGLGLTIPVPTWNFALWTAVICGFVVASRLITVFPTLHRMRLGHRVSLLPAINLCQISELSLVLLALGKEAGDVSENTLSIAAFSFAALAILSTYVIPRHEPILQWISPWLTRIGFAELPSCKEDAAHAGKPARVFLLGFSWTASSLLEEITRLRPELLADLCVLDFNPQVVDLLRRRGVRVIYGDISQRDTLVHAGVPHAEILICSLPDIVLKGVTNRKLLQQLRELNPAAQIVVHAELLAEIPAIYAAGASYVSAPRLLEAADLLQAIDSAEAGLLDAKRAKQLKHLSQRQEVIP